MQYDNIYLSIETMVSGALILAKNASDNNVDRLKLIDILNYAKAVIKKLETTTSAKVFLDFNQDVLDEFIYESKFFRYIDGNLKDEIKIVGEPSIEELKELYIWNLPIEIIPALQSSEALNAIITDQNRADFTGNNQDYTLETSLAK